MTAICICAVMSVILATWDMVSHQVPSFLFLALFLAEILSNSLQSYPFGLKESWLSALLSCFLLGLFVWLFHLGTADWAFGICISFALGYLGLVAIGISFLLCIPYTVYMKLKQNEHEYAFLPYMSFSYLGTAIYAVLFAIE